MRLAWKLIFSLCATPVNSKLLFLYFSLSSHRYRLCIVEWEYQLFFFFFVQKRKEIVWLISPWRRRRGEERALDGWVHLLSFVAASKEPERIKGMEEEGKKKLNVELHKSRRRRRRSSASKRQLVGLGVVLFSSENIERPWIYDRDVIISSIHPPPLWSRLGLLGSALLAFPSLAAAAVPFRRDGTKFPPHQHPPTSGIKGAHLIASNPAAAAATFIVSFSLCMFVYMEDKTIGANFLFLIDRKRRRNRGCSNSVRGLLPPTFYTVVIDTSSSLSLSLSHGNRVSNHFNSVGAICSFFFFFFYWGKVVRGVGGVSSVPADWPTADLRSQFSRCLLTRKVRTGKEIFGRFSPPDEKKKKTGRQEVTLTAAAWRENTSR